MKHLRIAALAIMALATPVAMGGCTTIAGWLTDASGPTSAPVAASIRGGSELYVAIEPVAKAYTHTSACNRDCRHTIDGLSETISHYLDVGLDAEGKGDNAAVAQALAAFNANYGTLWTYLTGHGQAVPAS